MKRFSALCLATLMGAGMMAQRVTDRLDRGLVAMPSGGDTYLSWRIFGEEYYDVTYNVYRNGSKIASGLKVSNFTDAGGNGAYQVAAVVRGVEQEKCAAVTRWAEQYLEVPMQVATDRNGNDASEYYSLNDVSLADLTGNGTSEFIVKRPCWRAGDPAQKTTFNQLDCYDIRGKRLWWIDLGPNMISGPDEQWDAVAYDWDEDGKAEVLMRGQDNMIIHHADGTTTEIGDMTVDTRWGGMEYTNAGNEYLLYLDGETGKILCKMDYPHPRGNASDWGDGGGHRATKHLFAAPFLDGRHASIFVGRGIYTQHRFAAFDVDKTTHQLKERWRWECNEWSAWMGQGYHNFGIADVDEDGRDEIVIGSMVIDDNGKGLSTTGLGHGDAQHCSDFDPYRKGLEFYACNEAQPKMNYRNATTSQLYFRAAAGGDDGRGLMANFSDKFPGCLGRSVSTGMMSSVADKYVPDAPDILWSDLSFRFYWDGDLLDEVLDSPGAEAREFKIEKPGVGRIFTSWGCKTCNSSKNNPCATGDILGDWREELVARTWDDMHLRIYVSPHPTQHRIYTLWHDHQYRQAMVWQSIGYNQPPHKSYFLGEMEGITLPPPPLTMTGRTEVKDGGVITGEDKHFLVCETGDSHVSIQDGASPYIVTFNVPSHVEGTAESECREKDTPINYTYYTCDVTGGALTGQTRLVKQGDGTLNLPAVEMTYTGETNIWAGTLNFDGTLKNSPLWLNRFAALNSGGTFGTIRADYASVIRPGGTERGTLTAESLTMGFGSRIVIDLYDDLTCDGLQLKELVIERKTGTVWEKYGPQYIMPVVELIPHYANGQTLLPPGDYVLGDAPELTGSLSDIRIEGIGNQRTMLRIADGKLVLTVESLREAGLVFWQGDESVKWDFASTQNFQNEAGEKDVFVVGDNVVFDDMAKSFSVSLQEDLNPDTVFVDGAKNYTFSGIGALTGNTTLVKTGTGTLTISNDNTFTGGVRISGGTVKVAALSNSFQSYGNLGGVTEESGKFIIENGATLHTTAGVDMGSALTVAGQGGGVINAASGFGMAKPVVGNKLTKKGNGWMDVCNNPKLDSLVIVAGGIGVGSNPAKQVVMQGGTLNLNGGSTARVHIASKAKATVNSLDARGWYGIMLTGDGEVTMSYPLVAGNGWYADRCHFNGDWSKFEGTVTITSVDGRFCLDNANGMPLGTFNLPEGMILLNTGKTFKIGKVTGTGILGGICTLGGSAGNANTWELGCDDDFTFSGTIDGNSNIVKLGTGTMTMKGKGIYTGKTTIKQGTLLVNSTASTTLLGTGALTVSKGASLCGRGTLGNSSVTISKEATLRSGTTETNASGKLSFSKKNVTVNGTIQAFISTKSAFSKFLDIKTLKLNGTLVVRGKEGLALEAGDELRIFEADKITVGANLQFDLCSPNAEKGYVWDTSRLSEGILVVAEAPTAISSINAGELKNAEIYTLQGIRLKGRPQHPGIYIVNGIKTAIK